MCRRNLKKESRNVGFYNVYFENVNNSKFYPIQIKLYHFESILQLLKQINEKHVEILNSFE